MLYAMSLLTVVAAAVVSVRSCRPRETTLVFTRVIPRPVDSVFEVIGAVNRAPVWRRRRGWIPGFSISRMSGWGGHSPVPTRDLDTVLCGQEEISIHHLKNREFRYRCVRPRDLAYESLFRVSPQDDKCKLVWEIRFEVHRPADILSLSRIVDQARAEMAFSLDYIQRLAISSHESIDSRENFFAERRNHAPAA